MLRPGLIVTDDRTAVLQPDCLVHMVAIPTERDGEPYTGNLVNVFEMIADAVAHGGLSGRRPLVIVESTLTPGRRSR